MVKYGNGFGRSGLYGTRAPSNRTTINKNKTNAPVKRVYKKPVAKTKVDKNKTAIMTLSKQVKALQMNNYGLKQFQHQYLSNIDGTADTKIYPGVVEPCAFMLNDFYNNAPIWQGSIVAQHPVTVQQGKFNKVITDLDLDHQYLWNLKQANDNVSQTVYLPISTTVRFSVQCQNDTSPVTTRTVQITIFKIKNSTLHGTVKTAMPNNLAAYGSMLHENPMHRNHFNTHKYHTIVASKKVTFTPLDSSRQYLKKYCTMKINFPAKPIQFDNTADPPSTIATTIPTKDQYWCLISSNTAKNNIEIQMERWNVWRDPAGIGS